MFTYFILKYAALVFSILLVARYVPGITVEGFWGAMVAALVLSLLNLFIKPLIFVLTLPLTLITFGLFAFVINAAVLWLAGRISDGFEVEGFIPALIGAAIISLVSYVISKIAK